MFTRFLTMCLFLAAPLCLAQSAFAQLPLKPHSEPNSSPPRELRVLTPTLAPEQIDRAVLNRLMQEILDDPDATGQRLQLTPGQLQDVLNELTNAHGFINDNDMANVQAMCAAWNQSALTGTARIREALAAYSRRAQFTRDFIARYYTRVLGNIEAGLEPQSLVRLEAYMTDRRRRMATAGAVTNGAISHNVRSGEESIRFHCRSE